MNFKHIHTKTIASTQLNLKKLIEDTGDTHQKTLISTDEQALGTGRQGAVWHHFPQALAFSFTLPPSKTLTLTPLEIGIHLAHFFSPELILKWPNDLLNHKKEKVGGIICQLYKDIILVGIGINLAEQQTKQFNFPYPVGAVYKKIELSDSFKKDIPNKIYQSILDNRLSDNQITSEWNKFCCHLNQDVVIIDGKNKQQGKFIGLGINGEAKLQINDSETKNILTGSLRFN